MIVEVVNQVRNGIRCSAATPEKYPHYVESALERLDEAKRIYEQGERRRELRSALQRIQRYSIGPEKQSLQTVIEGLDRKLVTDAVIVRMLPAAKSRLKSLPMPEQHRTLPASVSPIQLRGLGAGRVVTFTITTESIDRHGTIIRSSGLDTSRYESNPVVGWAHDLYGGFIAADMSNIVGRTVRLQRAAQSMSADIEFLPASVNPKAAMLLGMIKAGAVNAVSIGFVPKEVHMELIDGREIPVISKSELLEISVVAIPSQADALAQGRD